MYVCHTPSNDVSLILAYVHFFLFFFWGGVLEPASVDQPNVNQPTVDNGGGSLALAVGVSDR